MSRLVLIIVATLALGFAPVPFPKPDKSAADLKAMQGEWVIVNHEGEWTAKFTGSTVAYFCKGEYRSTSSITVNGAARPKSLDELHRNVSPDDIIRGIYRFDKGTLTICSNGWEGPRPTAFDGPGAGKIKYVLRRKSP